MLLLLKHLKIQSEVVEGTQNKGVDQTKKGVDTLKYCGTIKFGSNPVDLQRQMRDDWR